MRDKNDGVEKFTVWTHTEEQNILATYFLRLWGMKIIIFYTNYLSGEAVQVLKKKHRNKDF